MKIVSAVFLSATRLMAVMALLLGAVLPAQAATVLSLKGTTQAVKYDDDAEIRLSLLDYDEPAAIEQFVERYRQYQQDGDSAGFTDYISKRQTRGYVFTAEATGYTIKYAWQSPDDSRSVFVVTPGLKTLNRYMWTEQNQDNPGFTVLELRTDGSDTVLKTSLDSGVDISSDGVLQLQDFKATQTFAVLQDNTPYYLKQDS